jgi:1-deoxy-D-xylulose-5-phosphate synthase
VKSILGIIPAVGKPMIKVAGTVEEAIKKMVFPGLVFEELGVRYIGPVQGHNLRSLIEVFENAKNYDGPVLIHCVTQKGKGYSPAISNPEGFHSASPFDIQTGETLNKDTRPSFSSVFGQTAVKIAKEDEKVVAITAAMPDGTGLRSFADHFPERFFDVGIAEQHAVDFASGLALSGFKPVVAIYSTFLQRAYDQLYHDVCLMDIPILFALDRAGIVPDDGPTHQGINDIIYLRHLPNMIVMAPKDENELQHMIKSALSYSHPVAVRYPKGKALGVPLDEDFKEIPLGQSEVLKDGEDLLIAYGSMVYPALEAARRLEQEGISLAVVNARFAKPLDEEAILRFAKKGRVIITAEEGVTAGGFGSAVRELLDREKRFDIRFKIIGLPLEIYALGKVDQIKKKYLLDEEGLFKQIKEFYAEA